MTTTRLAFIMDLMTLVTYKFWSEQGTKNVGDCGKGDVASRGTKMVMTLQELCKKSASNSVNYTKNLDLCHYLFHISAERVMISATKGAVSPESPTSLNMATQ
jgi:hypothetical protein